MKICCSGAGPAGLYLAILAKRQDPSNKITVFEQNARDVTHGWGVVFWSDLLRDLEAHDPESAAAITRQSFSWRGQVVDIEGRSPVVGRGGGYSMRRQDLLDILIERALDLGVDVRFQERISDPGQLPDADLIVAADGVGSPLRRSRSERFGTRIVEGRNKYVWLGSTKVFDAFTFGFVPTAAGWIWFHAYGIDGNGSTFIVECTPETWRGLGLDAMDATPALDVLEGLFGRYLEGGRLLARPGDGDRLPWLNFRHVTNSRWYDDNLVLVGDAAHTAHFSIGSGTRLAMQDSMALARCLRDGSLSIALDAYETERKAALQVAQRKAGFSARWFENIDRYIGLESQQFLDLMIDRRSPWMPCLPPRLYHRVQRATREFGALSRLRQFVTGFYAQEPAVGSGAAASLAAERRPGANSDTALRRPLLERLVGRLRHGLLLQEFLDRLARRGLVVFPYFIAVENTCPVGATPDEDGVTFRWLEVGDAPEMKRISVQPTDGQSIQALLGKAKCLGAFREGQLAGFSWLSRRHVPVPASGSQVLFALAPDESYLFDMYVAPQYRGLRLAGRLRAEVYRLLAAEGSTRHYSITLAFNRSSRRFKARLGAREAELRLYVHARIGRTPGLDVRLWRTGERLRTRLFRRVQPLSRVPRQD